MIAERSEEAKSREPTQVESTTGTIIGRAR